MKSGGFRAIESSQQKRPTLRSDFFLVSSSRMKREHHELTARMILKLKDELAWTRSTGIARRAGESGEKAKRLLASVENFMDAERKGIKEYDGNA